MTQSSAHRNIYVESIQHQMPRLLGQINTNIVSNTYGCCDRQYWHNHTVTFPNARYQEAVLTLTLLYKQFNTPYFNNPHILDLINACISFWTKIQEKNGSFNEWYPKEGSYVATAFSSYAISETLLIMGNENIEEYDRTIEALEKAGHWLKKRTQKQVSNQQAGTLITLFNIHLLTGNAVFKTSAFEYENIISECQHEEGWFPEYGGADIGYLSLTIDYLAKYYKKTASKNIEKILHKAINFIINFIHKDQTSGGVYSSRETEYLIPHGFELFSNHSKGALYIAWNIRKNLSEKKSVSLFSLDDRYLMYIAYTFLEAALDGLDEIDVPHIERESHLFIPGAGLYIHRKEEIELIANLKKGGAFSCLIGNKKIMDSGVIIDNNQKYFSGYLSNNVNIIEIRKNGFMVESHFQKINETILTPFKSIMMHIFQMTLGRWSFVNTCVKNVLRNRMILKRTGSHMKLNRNVTIDKDTITIQDEIRELDCFQKIIVGPKISFIYVPSARLYKLENLEAQSPCIYTPDNLKTSDRKCLIIRQINKCIDEKPKQDYHQLNNKGETIHESYEKRP